MTTNADRWIPMGLVVAALATLVAVGPSAPVSADGTNAAALPFVARAVSVGQSHACAILGNGSVKCFGSGIDGALGAGDTTNRGAGSGPMGVALPTVDLGTGRTAVAISAGTQFTCAILDNGWVKCWGRNQYGQLGLGDPNSRGDQPDEMGDALPAVDLGLGHTAVAIGVGHTVACAVLEDGTVKCWGRNQYGQLGQEDFQIRGDGPDEMGDHLDPIDLGTGRTAVAVSVGGDELLEHVCALLDDGNVKCWGLRLGSNAATAADKVGGHPGDMGDHLAPVSLGAGRTVTALSTGFDHACATLDDRTLKCWGRGEFGALGLGDTAWRYNAPDLGDDLPVVALGAGRTAVAIATSDGQASCAILDDGSLKCWGRNDAGQLGLGDTSTRGDGQDEMGDALPVVDLGAGRHATSITMGRYATCATLDDGSLKCWGIGGFGLGDAATRGDEPGDMGDALPAVDLGAPAAPTAVLNADGPVEAGSPIPYHLTITNPGDTDLHGVEVEDPNAPDCETDAPFDLAPSASTTIDCSRPTTIDDLGTVTNEATVTTADTWPVSSNAFDVTVGHRHQPDGTIRLPGADRQGQDVYNPDGAGQKVVVTRGRGADATFFVTVQNDGTEDDRFDLRRIGTAPPGLRVRYFAGRSTVDVTAGVQARTWRTPTLAPGGAVTVRVEVTVRPTASPGTASSVTLRSRSEAAGTELDTVKAKVRITA